MKKEEIRLKTFWILVCLFILFFSPLNISKSSLSISTQSYKETIQQLTLPIIHQYLEKMLQQVNESTLYKHVKTIQDFGPHPTGSPALENVGGYIINEFESLCIDVKNISWNQNEISGNNIEATLNSTTGKPGIVIITAHYDTIPISPGAEDDGSGVAAILMLAEIMRNYTFNATIKFILFSGEEIGLLGSKEYAKAAAANKEKIIGVLALDKIGYALTTEEGNTIRHHADMESAWMVDISQAISTLFFDSIGLKVLRYPQSADSDHISFINEGFDGSYFARTAANPYYHTSEDNIEHFNFSYLTKACKLALGTFTSMACINFQLSSKDLKILIKGTRLSNQSQLTVVIENTNYDIDTVNATIFITMKHLFRRGYIMAMKLPNFIPCNWSFTKEISKSWEFKVAGRLHTPGLFKLEVIVKGIYDDIYIYKNQKTFGFIINPLKITLIPRL